MADFKYIMQGFQENINFFDEIKEVLEAGDYTSIWILTAFVNERAIYNLMPSIKKSKAIILCSDCHDPRKYTAKENLWIKAN